MSETKAKPKSVRKPAAESHAARLYESEGVVLQSLRLIAAPNPKDDLSDAELAAICKDPTRSSDLIRHLIECIKGI